MQYRSMISGSTLRFIDFTSGTADEFDEVQNKSDINFNAVSNLKNIKNYCSWCHAKTYDDNYGHCCACGGPRE